MYTLFNPSANITTMCIAQNGTSVVAAFEDGCFRHWDLSISGSENPEPPQSASLRPEFGTIFKGHSASIYSLDSFMGGRMVLSASEDGTVIVATTFDCTLVISQTFVALRGIRTAST